MNLSAPFIQRPIATFLLMIAVLFAGLGAYFRLPISNMPNVTYPTINVTVSYPGATPETMAHAIAVPLEKQFMGIPGVKLVSSNNTLGSSNIALQFDITKDMTVAAQDVQSAIITATPTLPPNLPYAPTYRKVNPAELPIIYVSLTSKTMRLNDLYVYANNLIGQRISMLTGVSQVTPFGSPLAIRIQVDPGRLTANDMSLAELAAAINLGTANLSTGQLDGPIEAPNISVDGQLVNKEGWNNLIVAYRNGTPIRIKDLGQAVETFQNDKISVQYARQDKSENAIVLAIQKMPDANAVAISNNVHDLLESLTHEIPAAVDVKVFFDRSISIRAVVRDVNITLIVALILVVLVIFFYLGKVADAIIPSIILPLSIIGTFIVMDVLHFTLDSLSLLALTLSVGFIIDDAIVVLENIVRHQEEEHQDPMMAAMEGSGQIGFTIVSMTLSLVAVFLPMLLLGGLIGKIFQEFAITLTAVTVISGIISLTLTPMLCSRFLKARNNQTSKFAQWSESLNSKLRDAYKRGLLRVLDHRYTALAVGLICIVATALLFYTLPTDFVPDEDVGFFIAYTQAREGGSSWKLREFQDKVITIMQAHSAVDSVVAISSYSEYRKGQNLVKLKPLNQRPSVRHVMNELQDSIQTEVPGLQVFMKNVPLIDLSTGQESRGDYQIALHSLYADKVYSSAKQLISRMESMPMFEGVNSDLEIDSPQINLTIQRDKASTLGITAVDIESLFLFGYSYNYVTRIETAVDQYDIILELLPDYQKMMHVFDTLWMRSPTSLQLVPLSATATWEEGLGASSINHIDQFPSVTISFNLAPRVSLDQALSTLQDLREELVDRGVIMEPVGTAQTFRESTRSAGYLILLAIFVIYIILGMLYESFIHPITILTTLPPAMLGGLLVLAIFGLPLSMYSYLGIILLIGIVKKNGIMMVDFALANIRTRGMAPKEAIVDACMVRFRPIMMTTAAAIFGALPIALGLGANGASRQPLGLVIIGGLCLAQLITLFMTPILYLLFEKVNEKIPWH